MMSALNQRANRPRDLRGGFENGHRSERSSA